MITIVDTMPDFVNCDEFERQMLLSQVSAAALDPDEYSN